MQSKLMRKEEAFWCPKVALNVVCSPDDLLALKHIAPGAPLAVVPNGADTDEFIPGSSLGTGVVFVGGMTWFPNKDALEYFSAVILPELAAIGCVPSVEWVGRELPGAREKFAALGISLTGYVDDVKPHVAAARCFVVPLRVGGGTRLKILSAWAMGKAVVTTSIGCEGLDTRDGWNALIRDDPGEFAAAIKLVLEDDALAARLGANARATAEKTYSWNSIGAKMRTLYASLTDADVRSRASNG
jgi:glycosyltransferase involved in cell wall biosynthesis